ncbi:nuclear transport factor 2 family protein [Kineobactrum sediminis]|uniref:Nuclear transport factor 2 family protein n=1 Tax=Kineobactrum sediminis TaxID=1905677 RepID=A0A2N5Y245_9GAMM|nr:nuclear transport factor 2 family protein [Kineobactrum sediminis]PLW82461.1 nuclear transport factor 2 family protein [Kineobactrum sediminis]
MDDARLIENLIYEYAERIDAGDLAGVAEMFRHAVIRAPKQQHSFNGYDEVLAMYQSSCRLYPESGTPETRHLTTNVVINVEGDKAASRAVFTVIQATPSFPLQPIISGRYRDSFSRVNGSWRFTERSMLVDFVGDCSAHLLYTL